MSLHKYTPADLPNLLAGWEIDEHIYPDGEVNLSLWRVQAYLKEAPEHIEKYALNFSCGRYADAYLPKDHTDQDLYDAIGELIWKCKQIDGRVMKAEERSVERYGLLWPKRGRNV